MEKSEINNLDIEVHLLDDVSSCGHFWQQRDWLSFRLVFAVLAELCPLTLEGIGET